MFGMRGGAGSFARAYECIDTQSDLEACGGCVENDSMFGEPNLSGGRDCTAIPNVDSVRCVRGRCQIGAFCFSYLSREEKMRLQDSMVVLIYRPFQRDADTDM